MKRPLHVVFLWHMHQPSYLDPDTGRALMPWVRVHAMKDYYDMARYVAEIPGARAVINVVPSLWDQLEHMARGEWMDEHEYLSRLDEDALSDEQRLFIADQFFAANVATMIEPYPVYNRHYLRFGPRGDATRILKADAATLRDIQVWFHLTWCGHTLREDPFVAGLLQKAQGFSREEKIGLLDRIRAFMARIPAYYRELSDRGVIEVATTPFYHPILPLLLDPDSAHQACPGMPLPTGRYAVANDADEHVARGLACHARIFGRNPNGCWPAEGSVSTPAVRLFGAKGVKWIATDEDVLRHSLNRDRLRAEEKFCFWRHEGVHMLFRDHSLSDLIGFVYQKGDSQEAAQDFVNHLARIQSTVPDDGRPYVVPVILDGENCWEFYREQGRAFLHTLYRLIVAHPVLRLVTASEALAEAGDVHELPTLRAGSWIDANFTTWVGDPVKNRAWTLLYQARRAAQPMLDDPLVPADDKAVLFEHILAAEGSDWFWWFGAGHSSDHDAMFDLLFRKRLRAIYRRLGLMPPDALSRPVDERAGARQAYSYPLLSLKPRLDGQKGLYWEWLAAGACYPTGGSMQRADGVLSAIRFGFDERGDTLFVRAEFRSPRPLKGTVVVNLLAPCVRSWRLPLERPVTPAAELDAAAHYAVDHVAEAAIRLYGVKPTWKVGEMLEFYVAMEEGGQERARLPENSAILLAYPSPNADEENWCV